MEVCNSSSSDKHTDKQCGSVFLTINGALTFHCTLCEKKYQGYENYAQHVIEIHFEPGLWEQSDVEEQTPNVKNEFDDALEESEMLVSSIKKQKAEHIVSTFQWEEATQETEKKPESPPAKASKPKQIPLEEKIRLANEEVLKKVADLTAFKPPPTRVNIPESERKFKCVFCNFGFKTQDTLLGHIRRHAEKKNFQCAHCSRMFCTRTEVETHTRRHTGERPYVCKLENCGKAYFTSGELSTHMRRHMKLRNVKCEVCERYFFDKNDLKMHMVIHTKERKFECKICDGRFSQRAALRSHMKLHENKREYTCEICGASFNQKSGLWSHMKTKHKDSNNSEDKKQIMESVELSNLAQFL